MIGPEIEKHIKTDTFYSEVNKMLEQDSVINKLLGQLSYIKVPHNDIFDSAKKELYWRLKVELAGSGFEKEQLNPDEIRAGVKTAILNYQRQVCFFYLVIDRWIKKYSGVLYKQYSFNCEYYEVGIVKFKITNHNNSHFYGGNCGSMYVQLKIKKLQGKELTAVDDYSTDVLLAFLKDKSINCEEKYTTLEDLSLENLVEGICEGN